MKRILFALLGLAACGALPAYGQSQPALGRVASSCGSASYTAGKNEPVTQDTTGVLCTASGGGGTVTANQGTANTAANGWPVKVTDGTNVAAVKAASTAPSATDPAVVVAISPNGVNANGSAASASSAPVVIASDQAPSTTGLTVYFVQPAASDNHANIKNGAGIVFHVSATNNSATINYLRLYNAATGFNGCNSATNLVAQWAIPASTSGAGIVIPIPSFGFAFSTGISICVTSGYATTDTTNATASAMSVVVGYR